MTPPPLFGINIDPSTASLESALRLAQIADKSTIDLVTMQDHPYNPDFLETWTLMTALASRTERVRFLTNMLNTPLRPPAVLAKMAATLDVISNGRLELGIGAGGNVQGMKAWDGVVGNEPGERYQAFTEYIEILQGLFANSGRDFSFQGTYYQVDHIVNGLPLERRIPLWIGAGKPRMLRLAGSKSDGWLIGTIYILPEGLDEVNRLLDEGAYQAGRRPDDIHRGYNLFGAIQSSTSEQFHFNRPGLIYGSAQKWVDTMVYFHHRYRHNTFVFWPVAGDAETQVKIFLEEVMPEVKQTIQDNSLSAN
jgi:alkanesulfonate monooxygenase SsuD/methylene tetrahydromethanopterin reductase-like flavin-dependent oxidoreductase (luciferase family)